MQPDQAVIIGIRSHIVSIDPTTGTEQWRTKLKSGSMVTTYVRDDRVFAGVSGELFCVSRASGKVMWHNKMPKLGYMLITFAADPASKATNDLVVGMKGHVVSLDAGTGRELWRTKLKGGGNVTVAIHGNSTILAGDLGELHALNRTVGNVLWTAPLKRLGHGMISLGSNEAAVAFAAQAQAAAAAT